MMPVTIGLTGARYPPAVTFVHQEPIGMQFLR